MSFQRQPFPEFLFALCLPFYARIFIQRICPESLGISGATKLVLFLQSAAHLYKNSISHLTSSLIHFSVNFSHFFNARSYYTYYNLYPSTTFQPNKSALYDVTHNNSCHQQIYQKCFMLCEQHFRNSSYARKHVL